MFSFLLISVINFVHFFLLKTNGSLLFVLHQVLCVIFIVMMFQTSEEVHLSRLNRSTSTISINRLLIFFSFCSHLSVIVSLGLSSIRLDTCLCIWFNGFNYPLKFPRLMQKGQRPKNSQRKREKEMKTTLILARKNYPKPNLIFVSLFPFFSLGLLLSF